MGVNAVEVYEKAVPFKAGAAITAGQGVKITGADATGDTEGTVAPHAAGADGASYAGVALTDAAVGAVVSVYIGSGVIEVAASAAVAAGADVEPAAGGQFATKAAGIRVGRAFTGASGAGKKFLIRQTY